MKKTWEQRLQDSKAEARRLQKALKGYILCRQEACCDVTTLRLRARSKAKPPSPLCSGVAGPEQAELFVDELSTTLSKTAATGCKTGSMSLHGDAEEVYGIAGLLIQGLPIEEPFDPRREIL